MRMHDLSLAYQSNRQTVGSAQCQPRTEVQLPGRQETVRIRHSDLYFRALPFVLGRQRMENNKAARNLRGQCLVPASRDA